MGISQCLEQCTPYKDDEGKTSQLMRDLFEIEFEVKLSSKELPDE